MGEKSRSTGLRTIFAFFLGLIFTVFVGVGVYTFYPPPEEFEGGIEELDRSEQEIRNFRPATELSVEERERIQEINRQRSELSEAANEAKKPWGVRTSIILIVLSTIALSVSLVRADQLSVISNGLLLGGVFTMLYGVGWIVSTESSITRFAVMTIALVVTVSLGYLRFVHRAASAHVGGIADAPVVEGLEDVECRVRVLEGRMNNAAIALGEERDGG